MSFLNNIPAYGNLYSKLPTFETDPLSTMREKFKTQALKQIKAITDGESLGRTGWYTKRPDGTFSVSLRGGNTTMRLSGDSTHIVVPSLAVAVQFYTSAIEACSAGELNDLFLATRREPKSGSKSIA